MNAQAILDKIEEDAKTAAGRIEQDALAKAEEWKAASRERIEKTHQTMLAQAQKEADEVEQRMLRMAELDDRKALLQKKRALIERVFVMAGEKLAATNIAEKRAFFLQKLIRCANGDETLIFGADQADWIDDRFVADANAALMQAGKQGALKLSAERRPGCAGLVLVSKGAEMLCTFEAFLEEARTASEQQVANQLFE